MPEDELLLAITSPSPSRIITALSYPSFYLLESLLCQKDYNKGFRLRVCRKMHNDSVDACYKSVSLDKMHDVIG